MVLIAWTQALFAQPKAKLKIFDSVGPLMPSYHIQVTEDAKADLAHYTAFERKIIVSQVRGQLSEQPKVETKIARNFARIPSLPGNYGNVLVIGGKGVLL